MLAPTSLAFGRDTLVLLGKLTHLRRCACSSSRETGPALQTCFPWHRRSSVRTPRLTSCCVGVTACICRSHGIFFVFRRRRHFWREYCSLTFKLIALKSLWSLSVEYALGGGGLVFPSPIASSLTLGRRFVVHCHGSGAHRCPFVLLH